MQWPRQQEKVGSTLVDKGKTANSLINVGMGLLPSDMLRTDSDY